MNSVHEEGLLEAERHKWIESQKRGADVGPSGVSEWYDRYWSIYCRHKCLEHLHGNRIWKEFDAEDFGLIEALLEEHDLLLELILDRAMFGMENLDLIQWALDWGLPRDRVIDILERLDLNQARIDPENPPRFARP